MIWLKIGAFALLTLALTILGNAQALPQERTPEPLSGIFCDSPEQVKQFAAATLLGDSVDAAIARVNRDVGDEHACASGYLVGFRGNRLDRVRTSDGEGDIIDVLVIGILTPQGPRPVPPVIWFSLTKVQDQGA